MARLPVGFDSAWTKTNLGAIVGALLDEGGRFANSGRLNVWITGRHPTSTGGRQRTCRPPPWYCSISRPSSRTMWANDLLSELFVPQSAGAAAGCSRRIRGAPTCSAPMRRFGTSSADSEGQPTRSVRLRQRVCSRRTPVLAMISLGWTLVDSRRPTGRLPKYNPERRKTFAIADWAHVCRATAATLLTEGASELSSWALAAGRNPKPSKSDQDQVDACICLIAALHLAINAQTRPKTREHQRPESKTNQQDREPNEICKTSIPGSNPGGASNPKL